jgi:hypothetical protein
MYYSPVSTAHSTTWSTWTYPVSEVGDVTAGAHQSVHLVDALHVLHDAEGGVSLDPVLRVEPSRHPLVQVPDYRSLATV